MLYALQPEQKNRVTNRISNTTTNKKYHSRNGIDKIHIARWHMRTHHNAYDTHVRGGSHTRTTYDTAKQVRETNHGLTMFTKETRSDTRSAT